MREHLNGTFMCMNRNARIYFTEGDTYQIIDGVLYCKTGKPYPHQGMPFRNVDEIKRRFGMVFEEVVL